MSEHEATTGTFDRVLSLLEELRFAEMLRFSDELAAAISDTIPLADASVEGINIADLAACILAAAKTIQKQESDRLAAIKASAQA